MIAVIWTHAIAATTWLGGSIFYIFVFKPQQEKFLESGNPLLIALAEQFRSIIGTCIVVLIASGTLLLFDRITDPSTTPTYIAVLATKIVLATWMFTIARRRWRSSKNNDGNIVRGNVITKLYGMSTGINLTLILGILIFFLSDILNALFIQGLSGK
ncbi:MAG: hypothetical protein MK035_02070 [Dehalococcoidia bacterium]|nr:hypothetical protein [Dehalococcoidia bacterium]